MSETKKVKTVVELDMTNPLKMAFLVTNLIPLVSKVIETSIYIMENSKDEEMSELAGAMGRGLTDTLSHLMKEVGSDIDPDDPSIKAAIDKAAEEGENMVFVAVDDDAPVAPKVAPVKTPFTYSAPGSNEVN